VIIKNVLHSLEPGETPSYSASHQAQNYVQRSYILQNIKKRFGVVAVIFSIYLNPVMYIQGVRERTNYMTLCFIHVNNSANHCLSIIYVESHKIYLR